MMHFSNVVDSGDVALTEYEMERVMETLETRCYDGMQEAMKSVGLVGIEYDEDVVCDVCRSVGIHMMLRQHSSLQLCMVPVQQNLLPFEAFIS